MLLRGPARELVEQCADPAQVARFLDQLVEERPETAEHLAQDEDLAAALIAVVAASRSLSRLCLTEPAALDVLADLDRRVPIEAADRARLVRWKRLELLRIAARDLLGLDGLEAVGADLADLADGVLGAAFRLAQSDGGGDGTPARLAVIAMGKLGARELNYASDIDVLFVSEGEGDTRWARRVTDVARACFRVDAGLRPEGGAGPLARSLASYQAYWDRWARAWELQALIKARAVAGDGELGREFVAAAAERVWSRPFGLEVLRELRSMKARAEGEVARRGLTTREVKRGPGGIRDVEFSVQLLQLVHGRHDPALRVPATLPALAELAASGYVAEDDAATMAEAYRFLRTVEHRLQLVEEQQVHSVPASRETRTHLARVMGYRDEPKTSAVDHFDDDLQAHQGAVRSIHERLFFRPLLEAFSVLPRGERPGGPVMPAGALSARLEAFGFVDVARTRQALEELTHGLTRSSRLMQQMLPLLLQWLSESPDPELGLLGLRTLATGRHRRERLVATFRDSPEAARRLCLLLGTSRLLLDPVQHNPDLMALLGDDAALCRRDGTDLRARAGSALGWRTDLRHQQAGLRRFARDEEFRIAAGDILGLDDVTTTGSSFAALAETVLESAVSLVAPPVPVAVIGMGRLGGNELSYASDLDVLIVFADEAAPHDVQAAERSAEELLEVVNGSTPSERIFRLDVNLRPEGKRGPLGRTMASYRAYYERWGQTWERQALVRARPVAGDAEVAQRFMVMVQEQVWDKPFGEAEGREIRRIKARVERERIPAGEDPQFHLKLGRGSLSDVEWTVQLLQLRHRVPAPGTMEGLAALVAAGAVEEADAQVLGQAYRFCERTRNRLYLVRGGPGDSLPTQAEQLARLARSLDTNPVALRDTYRRVTRRARQVVERLFYGGASSAGPWT